MGKYLCDLRIEARQGHLYIKQVETERVGSETSRVVQLPVHLIKIVIPDEDDTGAFIY